LVGYIDIFTADRKLGGVGHALHGMYEKVHLFVYFYFLIIISKEHDIKGISFTMNLTVKTSSLLSVLMLKIKFM